MSDELHTLTLIRALPARERALAAHLELVRVQAVNAPGCLAYQILRHADDARRWVIHETWRNAADLDNHLLTPHMQDFFNELAKLVDDIDTQLLVAPFGDSDS
jgi:quinol monooxygenase YgiN